MHGAMLRHQPGGSARSPLRKPAPRGASRMVVKQPLSVRLQKVGMGRLFRRFGSALLLVALGIGSYVLAERLLPYVDRPITQVGLEGRLRYVSQQAVQERIAPFLESPFFSLDLAGMRRELEKISWIAHAEVRRVWPDRVVLHLEEQLPVARWGDRLLLNSQGKAFAPGELADYGNLPQLYGPRRAQEQVMQQYQLLSQLLRPLGFSIARLELRERGSWYLSTTQGIELLLGRDHLVEKMRRFSTIYEKTLKDQNANIARVDLRYANGLAVAWREPAAPTADEVARRAVN